MAAFSSKPRATAARCSARARWPRAAAPRMTCSSARTAASRSSRCAACRSAVSAAMRLRVAAMVAPRVAAEDCRAAAWAASGGVEVWGRLVVVVAVAAAGSRRWESSAAVLCSCWDTAAGMAELRSQVRVQQDVEVVGEEVRGFGAEPAERVRRGDLAEFAELKGGGESRVSAFEAWLRCPEERPTYLDG